jgi:hypothetical protein
LWNEWQGKPKYSEKTCPDATWPDPELNPGRRGGKPATNHFSYGVAMFCRMWPSYNNLQSLPDCWKYSYGFKQRCFMAFSDGFDPLQELAKTVATIFMFQRLYYPLVYWL